MKRRRYASREELGERLAAGVPGVELHDLRRVLDGFAELGVDLDALVKIEVSEGV